MSVIKRTVRRSDYISHVNELNMQIVELTLMLKESKDFKSSHYERIAAHYAHAREKHPYFCDALFSKRREKDDPKERLEWLRRVIKRLVEEGDLDFVDLADCEVAEMYLAYRQGETARAVEECYDIIAVLLRAIDVLEGRQELGKEVKE